MVLECLFKEANYWKNGTMEREKETNNIICRCEEVTEQELRDAIRELDLRTADDAKRLTRAGMGLCQGRTCTPLLSRILAQETNKKTSQIFPPNKRPPLRPVKIGLLATEEEKEFE